jgi:hypothetical protein
VPSTVSVARLPKEFLLVMGSSLGSATNGRRCEGGRRSHWRGAHAESPGYWIM